MHKQRGFSLPEIMVGVAVIGILVAASVPNISSYLRSRGTSAAVEQVSSHMRLARSRAVMEGNNYFVQFISNNRYVIVDDDGGGEGVPGAAEYVAANRGNNVADVGERVLGPYELPEGLVFSVGGAAPTNPFTSQALASAISFPDVGGNPTVIFAANGTTNNTGYIAVAPYHEVSQGSLSRMTVLQVLRSTGSVEARGVQSSGT